MGQETETHIEEWAALVDEDLPEDAESVAREQRPATWRLHEDTC